MTKILLQAEPVAVRNRELWSTYLQVCENRQDFVIWDYSHSNLACFKHSWGMVHSVIQRNELMYPQNSDIYTSSTWQSLEKNIGRLELTQLNRCQLGNECYAVEECLGGNDTEHVWCTLLSNPALCALPCRTPGHDVATSRKDDNSVQKATWQSCLRT